MRSFARAWTLSLKKKLQLGGGYEKSDTEGKDDTLTITVRVSNGASRHAMPTIPELVYAALLYKDDESSAEPPSENFVEGVSNGDKLVFSFQRPDKIENIKFTLEVFAFVKTNVEAEDGTKNFSRNTAPFSKAKEGLAIVGDAINVSETIVLEANKSSTENGTVNLQIKVPDGCTLEIKELKIDGTTESDLHFAYTGDSPSFTIMQKESGISAGAYQVTFTVKKGTEIVNVFSEYINVLNGLCTDTWDGLAKGEAKEITQSMISSTVYVRGAGGWYDTTSPYNNGTTATADDDTNSGSFLSPFATIQKAIDKVIAINDGTSACTIYVDGTLTQSAAASANGMADFSALGKNLTLTIRALSGTATLDANALSRVIYAKPASGALNLTLENLVITGGNTTGNGGGICYQSAGGTLEMTGCEVIGCEAKYGGGVFVSGGTFTMESGTISECTATNSGGGVYINSTGTFNMSGTAKIAGCKTTSTGSSTGGGGIYNAGTLAITGGTISDCTLATSGGGVYVYSGTFTMSGGEISNCIASSYGGGVFITSTGTFNMSGTAKITSCKMTSTSGRGGGVYVSGGKFTMGDGTISNCTASSYGGGVYVDGSNGKLTMSGGTISGNTASNYGGGVYVSGGTFTMESGTISECTATNSGGGVYVDGSNGKLTMSGGTISGNTASNYGGGVYVSGGTFTMEGSASVPAGDDGKNDVRLASGKTITVAGALTAASPVATITLSDSAYVAGTQVLSAGTGVTIDDTICGKFAVSQEGWEIIPNDTAGVLGISIYLNSSSGDDANSGLTASKAVKTLSKAIELFESQGAQKIMVCAEYTLPSDESTLLDRAGGEHLTFMCYTGKSDVSDIFKGTFFRISQGDVTISNVTLDGKITGHRTEPLLYISGSTTVVTLGNDAVICNNSDSGVFIALGTFKMTGGEITQNTRSLGGGGVRISKGTFEMSGGIISGNNGGNCGGGVCIDNTNGTFTMTGGKITSNNGMKGAGVGVSSSSSKFEMSGGTISGNTSNDTGGGVYVNGKFTMNGGEITGNTATEHGGGVYKTASGTFTQGGTVSGNTPDDVYEAP